ncbi:Mariner Mos1 transposase [Anthophora quadrimaculata]
MVPSNYHLFRSLQHYLVDSHFKSLEEVGKSINEFIQSKPPSFYRNGIRQLPEKWKKCVESNGDYFET